MNVEDETPGVLYTNAILKRLQRHYLAEICPPEHKAPLGLTQLYRLYRYTHAEGYGGGGPIDWTDKGTKEGS